MNEPRTIWRHCACCGKDIEIELSGKKHWWNKRKIIGGGYFFFNNLNPRDMRRGWLSKFLPYGFKSKSRIHQFLSNYIWWWTIPEEECTMVNWKKPFYHLWWWIEDKLDPPERVEYWECEECFNAVVTSQR